MAEIPDLLRNIGLTESEIKVYLALLELGSTTKGPIVHKSGVASSKIYELLEKLIQKGLVSYVVKAGVKYFEAAPPSRILDYLKEKESEIKKQEQQAEKLIPELELKRSLAGIGSETQVFKGMKGAGTSFDDILKTLKKGDEYYVLGISKFTPHFERFVVNFHKKRAKLGIKCKIIVNELAKDIGKKLEPIKLTKVKYLQKELFTPVVFILYKDKALISIGLDEIFIQVKSKNLSTGLKAYADYMWSIGK
jgi:sugar-specific transcriptional regulator TrmB